MGELGLVEARKLRIADDAQLLEARGEFGADALEAAEIVARAAGVAELAMGIDAQHFAGDVGGRGGDLVGDTIAFRPVLRPLHIGPVLARDIRLGRLALDLRRGAAAADEQEQGDGGGQHGDQDDDEIGVEGHGDEGFL